MMVVLKAIFALFLCFLYIIFSFLLFFSFPIFQLMNQIFFFFSSGLKVIYFLFILMLSLAQTFFFLVSFYHKTFLPQAPPAHLFPVTCFSEYQELCVTQGFKSKSRIYYLRGVRSLLVQTKYTSLSCLLTFITVLPFVTFPLVLTVFMNMCLSFAGRTLQLVLQVLKNRGFCALCMLSLVEYIRYLIDISQLTLS